jgi:hypothetical protein
MSKAYLELATEDGVTFNGTKTRDVLLYADGSNCNVFVGASNTSNYIAITPTKTIVANDLEVAGKFTVNGNILPATTLTSDLGSTDKRFRDLYMSGNTIYLGEGTLSYNDGTIEIKNSNAAVVAPFLLAQRKMTLCQNRL